MVGGVQVLKIRFACAILVAGLASAASAATYTFDLTENPSGRWKKSLSYTQDGLDLTVRAAAHYVPSNGRIIGTAKVSTLGDIGLGVCGRSEHDGCARRGAEAQIDGKGANDLAIFKFGRSVTLDSITFVGGTVSGSDQFDLFADFGAGLDKVLRQNASVGSVSTGLARTFGIGAAQDNDRFRILSITVSDVSTSLRQAAAAEVPLPATGLALIGALGAVSMVRRRRS